MGTFNSSRFIAAKPLNLAPVASDVENYFSALGYTVKTDMIASGCLISLNKGGVFKSVLGMKTSLNVEIRTVSGGYSADAGVGIFGQQAIPAAITLFIAWPVLITQISGLIRQAKLDDEALDIVERSIRRYESELPAKGTGAFCVACGSPLPAGSRFCSECGAAQK